MKAALERGSAVHEWCEQIDEGATVRPDESIAGYCDGYKQFCNTFCPSWTHIEQPFDNGEWHGVIDRVGYLRGQDNKTCIVDIKTGKGAGKQAQERVATQLASYAMGWSPSNYKKVIRVGVYLMKDGKWKTVVYDDHADFERWMTLLKEAKDGISTSQGITKETHQGNSRSGEGSNKLLSDQSEDIRGSMAVSLCGAAEAERC
jgi:hypothetical protein|tara:strand:+ start:2813 stop:3421 length:609 start_codon:yes stop_codon:yes gene_type:complete